MPILYEQRPILRQDTIDRLWDLRKEIREVVWAKYPEPADKRKRERLEQRIEGEVISTVLKRFLQQYPSSSMRREAFETAQKALPLQRTALGEVLIHTEGNAWDVFKQAFDHVRATSHRGGSRHPERVVFGSILMTLPLKETVLEVCSSKTELKGVLTWVKPTSSSQ
jgi:hypothetical protein